MTLETDSQSKPKGAKGNAPALPEAPTDRLREAQGQAGFGSLPPQRTTERQNKEKQVKEGKRDRLQFAVSNAVADLVNNPEGNQAETVRKVAFDLLRAYQWHRVQLHAQDAPEDESELDDFVQEQSDSMAIYTRDNIATLAGSDSWEAGLDEMTFSDLFDGCEDLSTMLARLAYAANQADLRRFLEVERGRIIGDEDA